MQFLDADDVILAIDKGGLDDELNEIMDAIRIRQQLIVRGRTGTAQWGSGDKVRISRSAHIRPKYLLGKEAEIVEVKRTRAVCKLIDHVPSSRYSEGILIPIELLERV